MTRWVRLRMSNTSEIDAVLAKLDEIVRACESTKDRLGYFAAMYRRVTRRVRQGILTGFFEDGSRMATLDRLFADRYFEALANFRSGGKVPEAWAVTFRTGQSQCAIILQHLLLGMNAHIYLDLGIAAAQVSQGQDYSALEGDFQRINTILFEELNPTENKLGTLSPWIRILDFTMGDIDEWLARQSLRCLRESAWEFGRRLTLLDRGQWEREIRERDSLAACLGEFLVSPGLIERVAIGLVHLVEDHDVVRGIETLS